MNKKLIFIGILTPILILYAYIFLNKDYTINSVPNDFTTCGNKDDPDYNTGIKLILKDKTTKEIIDGEAVIYTQTGTLNMPTTSYSCIIGDDSENIIVVAIAKGYAPLVISTKNPSKKFATIEVSMVKSCSGGPSFTNNLIQFSKMSGYPLSTYFVIKESKKLFYETIQYQFGLNNSDYKLNCMESYNDRGGFIKAKGTYKDGSPFELYYSSGWCSAGGADCDDKICFSSTSEELENLVNITGTNCIEK